MTREEILTVLENAKLHAAFESDVEILDACMSALREQEEGSKGCEFCRSFDFKTARTEATKYWSHILLSPADTVFPYNYQFKFCPVCGRRLEEV